MRRIDISHRPLGRGYLLMIEGVQETILVGADDLLRIAQWCKEHRGELEREANAGPDEDEKVSNP